MKLSQLPNALRIAHTAGRSVYIKGAPGIGKTSAVRQFADMTGMPLIHIHAPLVDLLDIKGVISTAGDSAKFLPLNIWPKSTDAPVVILIDELAQAVAAIQNAFSQLLIDHQMGDIKLPAGSMVIATGNRREDKAATHNMPSHVINRLLHISLDYSVDDFVAWAAVNELVGEVISFIKYRPNLLHTFDAKDAQRTYASPRSWEYASDLLKAMSDLHDESSLLEILSGVVGEGEASEFVAYRGLYHSLQDPREVLRDPKKASVPKKESEMYAISTSIALIVDRDTRENFYIYLDRLPIEFAVMSLKTAKARWVDVLEGDGWKKFGAKHASLLIG